MNERNQSGIRRKNMSCCSDVMKPIEAASCCTPKDTVVYAAENMKSSGCGCSPVVENKENLKLIGVVTERDICHSVAADSRHASEISVAEIMRPASACCGEADSIAETKLKLDEHRTTSLPVINNSGSCCGTISSHHI
jgi:CBS domain-containing protein